MQPQPPKVFVPSRFLTNRTSAGHEVIDGRDGRPVTGTFAYEYVASNIASELNSAASNGRRALARALGCIEEDDPITPVQSFEY